LQELDLPVAFGGAVFNNIGQAVESIPGHFLGKTLEQVPQTVEKLMQTTPTIGKVKKPSKAYQAAYDHFVEQRAAIEAHLHASPALSEAPAALLNNTNHEFGNDIEAALCLGDLAMVNANLDWVKGLLLHNHTRLPATLLQQYLQQYHEAVKAVMNDKQAAPLLDWFAQLAN
jgi:hypothetical protein